MALPQINQMLQGNPGIGQATPISVGKKNIGSLVSLGSPGQQQLQNQSIQQILSLLQGGQSPFLQGQASQARQNYLSQSVPSLAERFVGMGAGGLRSSGFQGALAQGTQNFENQLQGQQAMQLLQLLLGPAMQDQNAFIQKQPGFWNQFSSGAAQGLGSIASLLPMLLL